MREREERLKEFNAKMVELTQAYGCRLAPVVIFPGDEQVSLASFLLGLGLDLKPGLQIVEVSE